MVWQERQDHTCHVEANRSRGYDIIKITGHQDLEMLRKYIKADHLDVAEKLSDKYDYFN